MDPSCRAPRSWRLFHLWVFGFKLHLKIIVTEAATYKKPCTVNSIERNEQRRKVWVCRLFSIVMRSRNNFLLENPIAFKECAPGEHNFTVGRVRIDVLWLVSSCSYKSINVDMSGKFIDDESEHCCWQGSEMDPNASMSKIPRIRTGAKTWDWLCSYG